MLGTIIQSIFCAHPGAGIRLNLWKLLGESRYPGALLLVLENFVPPFLPTRRTSPGSLRMSQVKLLNRLRVVPILPQGQQRERNASARENYPTRAKATRKDKISVARLDDAVTKFLSTYKHGGGTVVEKWICTLLIMNFINAKWQLRLIQMEV